MKRSIDIAVSIVLLLLLSPLILCLAVLVKVFLGSPVFFQQERPGLNGKLFKLYKFRTMTLSLSSQSESVSDCQRLTRLGRVLRKLSLDELPQLWNVLRGEMSLVGPRPLLVEYLPRYSSRQMRRHEVRPGITGWAQVNGRNSLPWDRKLELDVWYVENQSLGLDLTILFRTAFKVVSGRDVNQHGYATTAEFRGD